MNFEHSLMSDERNRIDFLVHNYLSQFCDRLFVALSELLVRW